MVVDNALCLFPALIFSSSTLGHRPQDDIATSMANKISGVRSGVQAYNVHDCHSFQ